MRHVLALAAASFFFNNAGAVAASAVEGTQNTGCADPSPSGIPIIGTTLDAAEAWGLDLKARGDAYDRSLAS